MKQVRIKNCKIMAQGGYVYAKTNDGQKFKMSVEDAADLGQALKTVCSQRKRSPEQLLREVANYFLTDEGGAEFLERVGLSPTIDNFVELLKSRARNRELVMVRQAFAYVAKIRLDSTLKSIGQCLGNRDHSTIIHSIRAFDDQSQVDKKVAAIKSILMDEINWEQRAKELEFILRDYELN